MASRRHCRMGGKYGSSIETSKPLLLARMAQRGARTVDAIGERAGTAAAPAPRSRSRRSSRRPPAAPVRARRKPEAPQLSASALRCADGRPTAPRSPSNQHVDPPHPRRRLRAAHRPAAPARTRRSRSDRSRRRAGCSSSSRRRRVSRATSRSSGPTSSRAWIGGNADGGPRAHALLAQPHRAAAYSLRNAGRAKLSPVVASGRRRRLPAGSRQSDVLHARVPPRPRPRPRRPRRRTPATTSRRRRASRRRPSRRRCATSTCSRRWRRTSPTSWRTRRPTAGSARRRAATAARSGRSITCSPAMYAEANAADPAKRQNVTGAMRGYA